MKQKACPVTPVGTVEVVCVQSILHFSPLSSSIFSPPLLVCPSLPQPPLTPLLFPLLLCFLFHHCSATFRACICVYVCDECMREVYVRIYVMLVCFLFSVDDGVCVCARSITCTAKPVVQLCDLWNALTSSEMASHAAFTRSHARCC